MRSNLSQEEFFQRMQKKPALQAILDHLEQYTVKELDTIHGQPLWIRQILVKMKSGLFDPATEEKSVATAELVADNMTKNSSKQIVPKHEVRKWMSGLWLMPCGMTGGMSIEIDTNDLFLIMDRARHFVTISSSYSTLDEAKWIFFLQNTIEVGIMTRSEYAKLVSDELGKGFTDYEANAKLAGPNSYVEPNTNQGLFKIIRHPVK